jgi:type IV pilus assembly protein PilV
MQMHSATRIQPSGFPAHLTARRVQRIGGFSLLEVLVSLLVLSIGLLGLASLQANAMKYNHSAALRSQATALAYDIADRMRANRQRALAGDYVIGFDDEPVGTALAATDLSEWRQATADLLPSGRGAIELDERVARILIRWDDHRGAEPAVVFEVRTQL